jgi:transcriptional regulator with XRE-family HTH domain
MAKEFKKTSVQVLFALNLSRLRKEAGLTQISLAKKTGLTHNFINDIENQKKWVSSETIEKISEALGVEPMHLFVNNDLWENAAEIKCMAMLHRLHKKVNSLFEECLTKTSP